MGCKIDRENWVTILRRTVYYTIFNAILYTPHCIIVFRSRASDTTATTDGPCACNYCCRSPTTKRPYVRYTGALERRSSRRPCTSKHVGTYTYGRGCVFFSFLFYYGIITWYQVFMFFSLRFRVFRIDRWTRR